MQATQMNYKKTNNITGKSNTKAIPRQTAIDIYSKYNIHLMQTFTVNAKYT